MKHYLVILTLLLAATVTQAQVGIGTTTPDGSAILDIKASGSAIGLLLPRLTTAERDATIKSPTAGLLIYNTTTKVLEVAISGSLWVNVVDGITASVASGSTSSKGLIGIGTDAPNANAVLDVTSTTKGVLLPKATSDPTGVEGMIYYNTTTDIVKYYNGTSWITLTN